MEAESDSTLKKMIFHHLQIQLISSSLFLWEAPFLTNKLHFRKKTVAGHNEHINRLWGAQPHWIHHTSCIYYSSGKGGALEWAHS